MLDKQKLIQEAYNKTHMVSIKHNGKNKNKCYIMSFDNDNITISYNGKQLTLPTSEVDINIDTSEEFYRDFICKQIVGMSFDQLRNYLYNTDNGYRRLIAKTTRSRPTRIESEIDDVSLIAAETYGTITAIRLIKDGQSYIVRKPYSMTSRQWETRIL